MPLDAKLLETLLHKDESTALDFKQEQYPFVRASVEQKAELLKDILAFANSWRRTTAYILIGVQEVKGGRCNVVGVDAHLDDSSVHEFVNGKTQRRVEFFCGTLQTEGTSIDYIEIPIQQRPIYTEKQYGRLRPRDVPIRDGSSTRNATPDEVARMGAEGTIDPAPTLNLNWADLDQRVVLPAPARLNSTVLEPLPRQTFREPLPLTLNSLSNNLRYPDQVITYTAFRAMFSPLGFRLYNNSGVPGKRIRFAGSILKSTGAIVRGEPPPIPRRTLDILHDLSFPDSRRVDEAEVEIREFGDRWEIGVDFGDIRPHEEMWLDRPLWFGAKTATTAILDGILLGDNLENGVPYRLDVQFTFQRRPMTFEDAKPFLDHGD